MEITTMLSGGDADRFFGGIELYEAKKIKCNRFHRSSKSIK
tara:strand:- start:53597 stop:53719 length:123 start_codon:yes stop_codon:yes gene_type:complete